MMMVFTRLTGPGIRPALRGVSRLGAVGLVALLAACAGAGGGATTSAEAVGVNSALVASGMEAEAAGKYDAAAQSYLQLFDREPDNATALSALVRNLRYGGRSQDAVGIVEQRGQTLLAAPTVKFEFAKVLLAAGREDEALGHLRDVQAAQPDDWKVPSAIGIALDAMGRYAEAQAAYGQALALSAENPIILNNMAMSQALDGRLQEAIQTLETAAGYNRANPQIRQNLALLYAANGEPEKARALAAMDLEAGDLETNLSFYRRFGGTPP